MIMSNQLYLNFNKFFAFDIFTNIKDGLFYS